MIIRPIYLRIAWESFPKKTVFNILRSSITDPTGLLIAKRPLNSKSHYPTRTDCSIL